MPDQFNLDIDAATQLAYEAADDITKRLPAPVALGFDSQLLLSFKRAQRMAVFQQLMPLFMEDTILGNDVRLAVIERSVEHTHPFWASRIEATTQKFDTQLIEMALQAFEKKPEGAGSLEHAMAHQSILHLLENKEKAQQFLRALVKLGDDVPPIERNPVWDVFFSDNTVAYTLVKLLDEFYKLYPYYLSMAAKKGIFTTIDQASFDTSVSAHKAKEKAMKILAARDAFGCADHNNQALMERASAALKVSGTFDRDVYKHLFEPSDIDNATRAAQMFYAPFFTHSAINALASDLGTHIGQLVAQQAAAEMKSAQEVLHQQMNDTIEVEVAPVSAGSLHEFRHTAPTILAPRKGQP